MKFLTDNKLQTIGLIASHVRAARLSNRLGVSHLRKGRQHHPAFAQLATPEFTQRDLHMAAARNLLESLNG